MDWIDDLIRYEKAKEREKRNRMQKKKIKTHQEKSFWHKEHRKAINKYFAEKCPQTRVTLHPLCSSNWYGKIKKVEQKLQEQLIHNLIASGFVVHQEILIPHRVWPIRLDVYAQKENVPFGFEVKRRLDIRGLGQVSWYSNYVKKVVPEMKVFLAFSCHEFDKFMYPEIKEYVDRLREDFGIGICGIRDPRGDAVNGAKIYLEKFDWYDICLDCIFSKGFYYTDWNTSVQYNIPKERIAEFDRRLQEALRDST